MWVSCLTPGSSRDSAAFACSCLGKLFEDTSHSLTKLLIREGLSTAADEAHGDSEVLAVPWPGGGGGDLWKNAFNFWQSSARIHITQAVGQLI